MNPAIKFNDQTNDETRIGEIIKIYNGHFFIPLIPKVYLGINFEYLFHS